MFRLTCSSQRGSRIFLTKHKSILFKILYYGIGLSDTSNNLFKQLDDALRDYEYYEETTTSKPVSGTVSFTDPVTTLVNETNRLMLELDSKYKAAAAEVKKEGVMPRAYWFDSYSEKAKL